MALWALLMFTPSFMKGSRDARIGAAVVILFMTTLFFLMMRTGRTYRWRRIFFVALGFLFPVGFIAALVALRGTMSIPIERMVSGDTPFCYMVIPMLVIPAVADADDYLSGIDSADGEQSALDRNHGWPLAGGDAGGGQGVVQLCVLLWRHRRGFCCDSEAHEDPKARCAAAAGAVGDPAVCDGDVGSVV
jgi:hypothetical protein